jgi:hypothetical protein
MNTAPRPKVLYITGMMRSGSTLVGNILNEVDGLVHVGELHFLWKNLTQSTASNSTCGCGDPLAGCVFWRPILSDGIDLSAAEQVVAGQRRLTRVRHTPARLLDPAGPGVEEPAVRERLAAYRAIHTAAGAAMIVDSSKVPPEPLILAATGAIDLRILHVVRSVHDTVESFRSAKAYIRPLSQPRAIGYWMGFNLSAEVSAARAQVPYLRVRYEDIVREPARALNEILAFAGSSATAPITAGNTVELGVNHTVTGNPDRFLRGTVTVAPRPHRLSSNERLRSAVSIAAAAPLALRYGYLPGVTAP